MQNRQRLILREDIGSATEYGSRSTRRKAPAGQESTEPKLLDVNGYIKVLAHSVSPALKEEIGLRAKVCKDALLVMADPARISTIFAALVACGSLLSGGGDVTVLTALVPLGAGRFEKGTGDGCALLSFRVTYPRDMRLPDLKGPARDSMLPALFNVRRIVDRYHGCFRLCASENGIVFNVYLPVVQQSSAYRATSETVSGGAKGVL